MRHMRKMLVLQNSNRKKIRCSVRHFARNLSVQAQFSCTMLAVQSRNNRRLRPRRRMISSLSSLPLDCAVLIVQYVVAPPIGPALPRDASLSRRTEEALKLLEIGGILASACRIQFKHWIEAPCGARDEAFNALVLDTKGRNYKVLRRIAKLMKGSVSRLDIRSTVATKQYSSIVQVHLQSLRELRIRWDDHPFPSSTKVQKLGYLLDSMPDLDSLQISITDSADLLGSSLARNAHRFASILLSYESLHLQDFSWDFAWRAVSLKPSSRLRKVSFIVPNLDSRIAEIGVSTLYFFCPEIEIVLNGWSTK